jgi:hypothetical protein
MKCYFPRTAIIRHCRNVNANPSLAAARPALWSPQEVSRVNFKNFGELGNNLQTNKLPARSSLLIYDLFTARGAIQAYLGAATGRLCPPALSLERPELATVLKTQF